MKEQSKCHVVFFAVKNERDGFYLEVQIFGCEEGRVTASMTVKEREIVLALAASKVAPIGGDDWSQKEVYVRGEGGQTRS
jgi:hypothetical protein